MRPTRPLLALLALTVLAAAGGGVVIRKGPLPVEADWHARAQAWFDSADEKARKQQMRAAGRALKQPCKYCHTKTFDGYTDKLDISRQMLALSAEHQVGCDDCHSGKVEYTELGVVAGAMWQISREQKVFCDHCHVKGARFEKLTKEGDAFQPEWAQRKAALLKAVVEAQPASTPAEPAAP